MRGRLSRNPSERPATSLPARAYPPSWRLVAAMLLAISRASLPAMLATLVLVTHPPVTPLALFRTVALFALLPGLGAWLVARALAAEVKISAGTVQVSRPGLRLEVPATAIARIAPWRFPLPGPGFSLILSSGSRLGHALEAVDPLPLLVALAEVGGVEAARSATPHPTIVYAHARAAAGPTRWYHLAGKFPVFALLPTAVLFNAHQHIAYGGTLGQYYLVGLGAYVETFTIYWTTVTIYLVLYASVWRGLAEGTALLTAWVAPSYAARVRRVVDLVCRVLYYGGVPLLLGIRFAPW